MYLKADPANKPKYQPNSNLCLYTPPHRSSSYSIRQVQQYKKVDQALKDHVDTNYVHIQLWSLITFIMETS